MGGEVTQLLADWRGGSTNALDELIPIVYKELRKLAQHHLSREADGHTLQATALVHEAYCKLVLRDHPNWKGRQHFFAVASLVMRRILIDHARSHQSQRRGCGAVKVALDEGLTLSPERTDEVVALDAQMNRLAELDARKARIVELRYFGGLTISEVADVLRISTATVVREWRLSKAWLYRELSCSTDRAQLVPAGG